ncbi:MAG: hypothetical protein PHH38_07035 [Candidatus Cloacimonetes bacterium]|nr:hypothetical protein [Candidatus Cloacimonadota bacterium]
MSKHIKSGNAFPLDLGLDLVSNLFYREQLSTLLISPGEPFPLYPLL